MYRNSMAVIHMRDDGGLDEGARIGGERAWLGFGYILGIRPTVYTGTGAKK